MTLDKANIFEAAQARWGKPLQLLILVEECGELIQAVVKLMREETTTTHDNLLEELADVSLMCDQVAYMEGRVHRMSSMKDDKIKRLWRRLQYDD